MTPEQREKLRRIAVKAARDRFPGATWTGAEPVRNPDASRAYWIGLQDMYTAEREPIRVLALVTPGTIRVRRVERGAVPVNL